VAVHGEDAAAAAILRILAERQAGTRKAVARGAHLIEAYAKLELTRSSHPPGTPTPSPPGAPPSLVTGSLRRSITVRGPLGGGSRWEASVGPTIVYGRIQELGGVAGGRGARLPARPYMSPALRRARPQINALFRDGWDVT